MSGPSRITASPTEFMLNWALMFLIVALIAGVLGFTGIAGSAAYIALARELIDRLPNVRKAA